MKKFWRWASNQDDGARTLYLNGVIAEESWFEDDITPALFKSELETGTGPVMIWINSPGGDCVAAAQIYNMLMDYPSDVTVQIDGIAASAASVVAMAGTRVLMSPVSVMMIHNPLTVAMGDSEEMRKAVQMLDEFKESILNAYELKTGLSRTRLSHMMDAETWLSAGKAIELRFADGLLFSHQKDAEEGARASDEFAFSRRAATNSLLDRLGAKKPVHDTNPGTPVAELEKSSTSCARADLLRVESVQADPYGFGLKLFIGGHEMSTILDMRAKRARTWEAAKAFLDSKRGSDGILSPEDVSTYEKMESDVVNLGREIDRLERQAALDAELARPVNEPLTGKPGAATGAQEKKGRASDDYRASFWRAMKNKSVGHEVFNALQIGADSEGGFLVPDEFERTLIQALADQNIFRQMAKVIQTTSGDRKIPVVASHGSASWVDEEGAIPESDDAFGQISIGAYKLASLIKVSEELLGDAAFNVESYIAEEFARRIGAKEEEAFCVGDGNGKPTGIFAASGGAELGVTAASATAINLDEVLDLFYAVRAPYRRNAAFVMNDSTVKALRKLKDSTGAYLWQPSVVAGEPDTLLARPVYTTAYAPAIAANAKVLAFGDFSFYWIADRQTRAFKRLNELYAASAQVGFLGSQRVDGKLLLGEAVKILRMKSA